MTNREFSCWVNGISYRACHKLYLYRTIWASYAWNIVLISYLFPCNVTYEPNRLLRYPMPRKLSSKTIFVRAEPRVRAVNDSVRIVIARIWSWNLQACGGFYYTTSDILYTSAIQACRYKNFARYLFIFTLYPYYPFFSRVYIRTHRYKSS